MELGKKRKTKRHEPEKQKSSPRGSSSCSSGRISVNLFIFVITLNRA